MLRGGVGGGSHKCVHYPYPLHARPGSDDDRAPPPRATGRAGLNEVLGGGIASAPVTRPDKERPKTREAQRIIGMVEPSAAPQAGGTREKCTVQ